MRRKLHKALFPKIQASLRLPYLSMVENDSLREITGLS